MLKLTATLLVALYAAFVIWGEPADFAAADASTDPDVVIVQGGEFARPVILAPTADETPTVTRAATEDSLVPDPAVIAASAPAPSATEAGLIGEPTTIRLFPEAAPAAAPTTPEPELGPLLRVTGTVVNMRAGPSTANSVVDALPRGTVAEALGEVQNGWQQIRDVATGQVGWMASRFLEPT